MKLNEIQKQIDKTEYWDMEILDMKISYFGDEIEILIDDEGEDCWKIVFLSGYKVYYKTDANRRGIDNVKFMKRPQLGYYGQDISVSQGDEKGFYKITMDLSIMDMVVECKDVEVSRISKSDLKLFWM